jgi:hypothetical protein
MFPTPVSMTEGDSVLVRGSASDGQSKVKNVRVNNLEATTSDNYTNWQVNVPLSLGGNVLTVSVTDSANNTNNNAATVSVKRSSTSESTPDSVNSFNETSFTHPVDMVFDQAHNRLLISMSGPTRNDGVGYSNYLLAVDMNLGSRTAFGARVAGGFLGLDEKNNRLLSIEQVGVINSVGRPGIAAYDLENGIRTVIIFDDSSSGLPNPVNAPTAIAASASSGAVLLANGYKIYRLTGGPSRTLLTDNVLFDGAAPIANVSHIAIDDNHNRALVTTGDNVIAIDLTTGFRTYLSFGIEENQLKYVQLAGPTLDTKRNRALIFSYINVVDVKLTLNAVDLDSGNRTEISNPDNFNAFGAPSRIEVIEDQDIAYVLDGKLKAIIAMDLVTGHRVIFSK